MSADGHVHGASDLGIGTSVNKAADFSFAPSKTQWTVGANGRRDTNQHQIVESDFLLPPRSALSDLKIKPGSVTWQNRCPKHRGYQMNSSPASLCFCRSSTSNSSILCRSDSLVTRSRRRQ